MKPIFKYELTEEDLERAKAGSNLRTSLFARTPAYTYIVRKELDNFAKQYEFVFVKLNEEDNNYIVIKDFSKATKSELDKKTKFLSLEEVEEKLIPLSDVVFYCKDKNDRIWLKKYVTELYNATEEGKSNLVKYYQNQTGECPFHLSNFEDNSNFEYAYYIDLNNNFLQVHGEIISKFFHKTKHKLKRFCKKANIILIDVTKVRKYDK